ncbi:MAG: hypothetical protein FK732_09795 [Asgard group archaeon]|nr:hypothetical protein [Asgard group archaeon]
MADMFTLAINVFLASLASVSTVVFWFTWRKRPDLVYWFISLVVFASGHILLIFKQWNILFAYLGNAVQLAALLIVMVSTFYEYVVLIIRNQEDVRKAKQERRFLGLVIHFSLLVGIITIILIAILSEIDVIVALAILMIALLIPLTIFVMRIYRRQRTITRLLMSIVFLIGALTAASTIVAVYFYNWGTALNYAFNFIFMTLILTGGLAAPIEQRITDSEESYKHLSEDLEEIVKERTQELEAFSYSVSHDLKAPLRSIAGFSKAIKEDYSNQLDDKGIDYLTRIIKSTDRMNELIGDMLDLSQISRADLIPESVNLSEITQEITNNLSQSYPEHDIEFDIQDNVLVKCDVKLIRIALENLLSNAVKFSLVKSKSIINFGEVKQDNKRVFFVKDNGVGFDMKYYDKLFGLFQRLHSIEEFEGTGVGLITVKRIIDRHKGEVWAESKVNEGATFYFTFGNSD